MSYKTMVPHQPKEEKTENILLSYFDLNRRVSRGSHKIIETKAHYDRLMSPPEQEPKEPMPPCEQLLMYFAILIGVIFSSEIIRFKSGGSGRLDLSSITLLTSAVVAIVIAPIAFEKLAVRPESPFLARFGLFVQHGVFWHVLFGGIAKSLQ